MRSFADTRGGCCCFGLADDEGLVGFDVEKSMGVLGLMGEVLRLLASRSSSNFLRKSTMPSSSVIGQRMNKYEKIRLEA
jgi:hypothetical protein